MRHVCTCPPRAWDTETNILGTPVAQSPSPSNGDVSLTRAHKSTAVCISTTTKRRHLSLTCHRKTSMHTKARTYRGVRSLSFSEP